MLDKYGVEYNMQRDEMKERYLNGEKNNFWIDGRHESYESDWKSNKDADRIRKELQISKLLLHKRHQ